MSNPPRPGTPEEPINAPRDRQPASRPSAAGRPQAPPPAGAAPPRTPPDAPRAPGSQARPAPGGQPPAWPQAAAGTQRQPVTPRGVPTRTTGSHGRLAASQQRQPVDLGTRLDGQRGWLSQIDRSLKKRSIIALLLTCLAVGVGAAALYIALTKNADGDRIDALQTRVEALEAAAGIPSTDATDTGTTVPGTESAIPETGVTIPDTGATLPDGSAVPPTGSDDLTIPGD